MNIFQIQNNKKNKYNYNQLRFFYKNESDLAIRLFENDVKNINWFYLCENKNINAIKIIENNLDKLTSLCWGNLSANPSAISILQNNIDKINWKYLSMNPNSKDIFELYPHKIDTSGLAYNESLWAMEKMKDVIDNNGGINVLDANFKNILLKNHFSLNIIFKLFHFYESDLNHIVQNTNDDVIYVVDQIIKKNIAQNEYIWYLLCLNYNAVDIIKQHLDYINWSSLSNNHNAIGILSENIDKIDLEMFASNKNGIHILITHFLKDNYKYNLHYIISVDNNNVIHYEYDDILESKKELHYEYMAYIYDPDRILKQKKCYEHDNMTFQEYFEKYYLIKE